MRILLSNPIINTNVKNAALAFQEAGFLEKFVTSFCYAPGSLFGRISALRNREISGIPKSKIVRFCFWFLYQRALNSVFNRFNSDASFISKMYKHQDRLVTKEYLSGIDIVYGYEDSCAETFSVAKEKGIFCVYELPIMFYKKHQKIVRNELAAFPDFQDFLPALNETDEKVLRKNREIELADHIIVASTATRNSLIENGVEETRVSVIPYGAPVNYMKPSDKRPKSDVFRGIFVGSICPRKGVHHLIEAWKRLPEKNKELLLVGEMAFPEGWIKENSPHFRHINRMPHCELVKLYQEADVFIFPSLVEGFGLVILEAMACGLPVIASENTAGPDIVSEGVDGFVIPIRNNQMLLDRLSWCTRNRNSLKEMGLAARSKAEFFSWERYRSRLVEAIMHSYSDAKVKK